VLRILWKNSQLIRDSVWISRLFLFKCLFKFFKTFTMLKFNLLLKIFNKFIARNNITLDNFLKILEMIISTDLELSTNSCPLNFIRFLYVNVNNVVVIEFPSQSEVIRSSRGWSEDKLTDFNFLHQLQSSTWINVLEFRMIYSSGLISALLLISWAINFEGRINQIFIWNMDNITVNIVQVRFEIFDFAVK